MNPIKYFEEYKLLFDKYIQNVELLYLNVRDKEGFYYPTDCIDLNTLNNKEIFGHIGINDDDIMLKAFNFNIRTDILYCDIELFDDIKINSLKEFIENGDMIFKPYGSKSFYDKKKVSLFNIEEINLVRVNRDKKTLPLNTYDA